MAVYEQPDSAARFQHHTGLPGVQRKKIVPRRVVSQQAVSQDPNGQEYYDDGQGYAPAAASLGPSPVYYFGAILSLGLIAGIGTWGYQIAMRDVNGIPVVQALDFPARVQPENPGGRQAAHQGLAVNEVQATGEASAAADRLILAPPPIDLIAADEPVAVIIPAVARTIVPVTPEDDLNNNIQLAVASAVAQVNSAASQTLPDAETSTVQRIATSVPGVSRSKVPMTRPQLDLSSYDTLADRAAREAAAATTPNATPTRVAAVSSVDVDPASITVGTKLVQIGAFDSEATARSEWNRLTSQFSDVFEGKQRLIQSVTHSGRSFYRLRVHGFDDAAQTGQFCSELIARSVICIPVEIR